MGKNDSAAVQIMSDGLGKGASSGGVMMGSSYQSSSGSAYQQTHYSSGGTGKAGPSGYEQMAMRDGSEREIVKMTPHGSEQMHQEMHTYRTSDAQPVKYSSGDMGKAGPSGYEQMAGSGGSDGGVLMRKTPHGSEPVYPQSQGFGEIDAQAAKYRSGDMGKAGPSGYEQMAMRDGSEREIVKMTPHGSEQMHQGMQPFGGSDAQAVKYSSGDMGKAGPSGTEQIASGYATAQGTQTSAAQAVKFDPQDTGKAGSSGFEQIAGTGMETGSISTQGTQTSEGQAVKFDPSNLGKEGPTGTEQIAGSGQLPERRYYGLVRNTEHGTEPVYPQAQYYGDGYAQSIKFDPSNLGKEGPTGTEQIAGSGQLPERRYYGLVRNTEHGTEPVYPQAQYYGDSYARKIKFDPTKLGKVGSKGTEQIMSFDSMDRREYINTDELQQIIQNLTSIKQRLTSFSDSQRALKENMHRAWNGTTGDKAYEKLNKYENKYNKYIKMINKRIRFLRYVIDQYTIWDNEINQKIDDNFSKKM